MEYGFWFWETVALGGFAILPTMIQLEFYDEGQTKMSEFPVAVEMFKNIADGLDWLKRIRWIKSFLPIIYIQFLPSCEEVCAPGDLSHPGLYSIGDYIGGGMVYPEDESIDIPGGATGAATGIMFALMYLPLFTLWRMSPVEGLFPHEQIRLIIAKIMFFLTFLCHFVKTSKFILHDFLHLLYTIFFCWFLYERGKEREKHYD